MTRQSFAIGLLLLGGPSEPYRVLFLRPADREDSSLRAQDILKQIAESVRRGLTAP